MSDLIAKIKHYENISRSLDIPKEQRSIFMNKVLHFTNNFIEELPHALSFIEARVDEKLIEIDTDQTKSMEEILSIFKNEVNEKGLRAASGGHVGYIPGGGIYAGAIGDFLAAISNEYAGVSYASPGATAIENASIKWLKMVFGFPDTAVGNLTSGGSIANMIALTAARDTYKVKNEKISKSVLYLSEHAHYSVRKALKIIGLEDVQIRILALDSNHRICVENLEKQIIEDRNKGLYPFLIIAAAGTTNVGAIDPLNEIADIAQKYSLWFHIDAAYGGFFILTSKKELFNGIEKADSIIVDPHKGMFLPYGLGAVLIKNAKSVLYSHQSSGDYLQDAIIEDLTQDPSNLSPELTKHFRGMRMWLPLQLYGIKPFIACLEEKLLLTQYFRLKLKELGFDLGPEPDLSVSYFWYPFKQEEDKKNKALMDAIHKDGRVFLSSTLINNKFVIRMAILSFRTKKSTIDTALAMIKDALMYVQNI